MTDSSNRSGLKATAEDTTTYLSDDRRATISRWMKGNPKLGPGVYSYSRTPGKNGGTCPGSSQECEDICYAKRIVNADVLNVYRANSSTPDLPPLPSDAKLVRFHVSGDFDSIEYIQHWIEMVEAHPDVRFWGYTRSWRVPTLRIWVEGLRAHANVQLFASVDNSMEETPDPAWRRAWIDGDPRLRPTDFGGDSDQFRSPQFDEYDATIAYVCPEETGRKKDCVSCGYCIRGKQGDVVFLKH